MDKETLMQNTINQVEADMEMCLDKMGEYGSHDFDIIATGLGYPREAGVAFYLLGKCARLISAYRAGVKPSDDTWKDITVYSLLGRMIRSDRI